MARVTVEDCIEKVPNRFSLVLLAGSPRPRHLGRRALIMVDRDNDKNPVVALREIADDIVDADELRENLITTLQRVDERSEAEEEAETLALLADPHAHADERAGAGPRPAERPRRRPGGAVLSPRQPTESPSPPARRPTPSTPSPDTASSERAEADARRRPVRAQGPAPVRADRAVTRLRPHRRRGAAEPRLCLCHAHARLAEAGLGRPLFRPPDRGGGHPHRLPAGHRHHRHGPAARRDRGHRRPPATTSPSCSARRSPSWSRASPSSRKLELSGRAHAPGREPAQVHPGHLQGRARPAGEAGRPPAQHAHAAASSSSRPSASASPARRWTSTPRWPAPSACTASATELEELAFEHLNPVARNAIDAPAGGAAPRAGRGGRRWSRGEIAAEAGGGRHPGPRLRPREARPTRSGASCSASRSASRQLSDIYAFRVIVDTEDDCYRALGVIHRAWPMRARAVQGLHLHAQAQQLPLAAHHGGRARGHAHRDADPHRGHGPGGRGGRGRPLALQEQVLRLRRRGPGGGRRPRPAGRTCATSSRCWSTAATPRSWSSTPSWRCTSTRSSSSRPRAR